jgi:MFS family permease
MAGKIGPRLPMTLGPLVAAAGVLLLLRIGQGSSYAFDVLPAVTVFGLGLALLVAPLTTTVLAAAADRHAGVASGVNNAIARAAALLAVAVLPVVAGISGTDYEQAAAFSDGFRMAMMVCAALLVAGALIAALMIRNPSAAPDLRPPERRHYCGVEGPPLQPDDVAATGPR